MALRTADGFTDLGVAKAQVAHPGWHLFQIFWPFLVGGDTVRVVVELEYEPVTRLAAVCATVGGHCYGLIFLGSTCSICLGLF